MPDSPRTRTAGRPARAVVLIVSAALAVTGLSLASSPAAQADTAPQAQSVGRFLDGALGGNALQQLADLQDARATAPGSTSVQNPLSATVLGSLNVPLTGALQLPGGGAFTLGAANQVAVANADGSSYGASGAASNSGGAALGGNNASFPANATINLSAAAVNGLGTGPLPSIPIPGATSLAALGGITASIGAVSALAQTKVGGTAVTPNYNIAGLTLTVGSPALGGLLSTLTSSDTALVGLLGPVTALLGATLPASCAITPGVLPATISLDSGAVVLDPATGSLTIDLEALLQTLHLDLNTLPPNTDLLSYLFANLSTILTTGLESVVTGITTPLESQFQDCVGALGPLGGLVTTLLTVITTGQATLEGTINGIAATVNNSGATGLGALTSGLRQVIDIGVNVQPNGPAGSFTSQLKATPDQATAVVPGQTIVRAVEINLIGDPLATIALANAAAGPSAAVTPTTPVTPTVPGTVNTAIPTGVNAGSATPAGSPALPLLLVALGLMLAGGGAVTWKWRGRRAG
jgi:hypothetical protein